MKKIKIGFVVAGFVLAFICGFNSHASADGTPKYPPPGKLVEVENHLMHIYCTGKGSPVVILEAGLSSYSLDWSLVQPEISKKTMVCSYDRSGYGWSEPGKEPRTAQQVVKELHELLLKDGVKGPYVLVGQSLGGIFVQLFALTYPAETDGIILVDSVNRNMDRKIPKDKLDKFEGNLKFFAYMGKMGAPIGIPRLLHMPSSIAIYKLPEDLRPEAYWLTYRTKTYAAIYDELDAMRESEAEFDKYDNIEKFPNVPVVVLSGAVPKDYPPFMISGGLFDSWKELQTDLAKTFPHAKHIIAGKSGHFIQLDQPGLVIDTVDRMVESVRH